MQEISATPGSCARCDTNTIRIYDAGMVVQLSRKNVPTDDATVLHRYGNLIFRVWRGAGGSLYASTWFPNHGTPDQGRLLVRHVCGFRP